MTQLTGITINVGKIQKFVGKVGIATGAATPYPLLGVAIFYRVAPYVDAYSYETDAIGADVVAVEYAAAELGAVVMVNYCPDVDWLIAARMHELRAAPIVDLGERAQYRLNRNKWRRFPTYGRINLGYTRVIVNVDDLRETKPPAADDPLADENWTGQIPLF